MTRRRSVRSIVRAAAPAAALALAAGCASNAASPTPDAGPALVDGFDPPPPGPGEIQILSPIIHDIPAGADITYCTYLPLDVTLGGTVDVVEAHGFQSSPGGHHSILYVASRNRPVDTHECTDDDMTNTRFVAGAGGGDAGAASLAIPPGIAFRVDGGKQLMVQTHWINASDQPIDGQAAYDLRVQPPSDQVEPAELFTWGTTQIDIPAGGDGTAHSECTVQQDLAFFSLIGHAHEWGTHVTLTLRDAPADGGAEHVFYDHDWDPHSTFDPPMLTYAPSQPFVVHAGQTLVVDCSYVNTTTDDLVFPLEMCLGAGFFFPGDAEIDCIDGGWPSN